MATLLVIHGADPGRRYQLDQPVLRIGRDSSNPIRVSDNEISRQHAEIRSEQNEYKIVDLNSSNGTYVNGRRVTEAKLSSGDRIQVGQSVFVFGTGTTVARGNLAEKISLITQAKTERSSGIVKSISQGTGAST